MFDIFLWRAERSEDRMHVSSHSGRFDENQLQFHHFSAMDDVSLKCCTDGSKYFFQEGYRSCILCYSLQICLGEYFEAKHCAAFNLKSSSESTPTCWVTRMSLLLGYVFGVVFTAHNESPFVMHTYVTAAVKPWLMPSFFFFFFFAHFIASTEGMSQSIMK